MTHPRLPTSGPGTALRLRALDAPLMTTEAANLVVGAGGTVTFPAPAFLIEHDRALVLFDTGFAPRLSDDPVGYFGELADVLQVRTHPGQRIDRQLAALGFDPEDVTHVVLSHGHSDHAGGVRLFPRAQLLVGPGELSWSRSPSPASARYFRWRDDLEPLAARRWTTVESPVHDVLGDGSLTVLHTPGHTPGQLSLVVRLPARSIVLTGDTVHLREGLDRLAPYPHDWDPRAAVQSLQQLRMLETAGHTLWIGHDPDDWARFGPLTPHS
ncbi:N-acyl homoserine lactonase family protein [Terrabacter aerolatus]|uniref:N-acyl homoserine lactonase AttM n=1 Tax=Terrabacter aerolatus TaxID=422442 RepID=A0A512D500_9MICO|nr:N-acyl homoserine lactonase family protein [Terrabacter aerolatus]GEO31532.1 N-acyl homoserine lactonase AttM [Terrabacter aerolatus]